MVQVCPGSACMTTLAEYSTKPCSVPGCAGMMVYSLRAVPVELTCLVSSDHWLLENDAH